MNISILVASLKYLNSNFILIVSLCSWISIELKPIRYNEAKILSSLHKQDFEITESLFDMCRQSDIFYNFIWNNLIKYNGNVLPVIDFHLRQSDSTTNVKSLLNFASGYHFENVIRYILDDPRCDIECSESTLINVVTYNCYECTKLILDKGVIPHYIHAIISFAKHQKYHDLVELLESYQVTENELI